MPETLDVDVLIVGGGPAGLSAAIRLTQLQKPDQPLSVVVLEKSADPGAHALSGAVFDPAALAELMPDFRDKGAPLGAPVATDALHVLTTRGSWRSPFVPPPLDNHGHYVLSLAELVQWLWRQAEAAGVDLLGGVAAADVLWDGGRVAGVRTREAGRNRAGEPTPQFQPGVDVRARVTIFCDGVRGNLTKTVVDRRRLDTGRLPQLYALGLKELWEVPAGRVQAGSVAHTLGYPLRWSDFGGGFIYGMKDGLVALGFVAGLDYRDPLFDPYVAFQRFKQHPFLAAILSGGSRIRYGAKALPEGGWYSIPEVSLDGALIAGDAGGFLNATRLKGIHLAMRTGMLAAEAASAAVQAGDTSAGKLGAYREAIEAGVVRRELYPVRNVRQAFQRGLLPGLAIAGWSLVSDGWWFGERMSARAGHERLEPLTRHAYRPPAPTAAIDRRTTFDRNTSVHFSGTRHREDQPSHLIVHDLDICRTRCTVEYANPCTRYCPANVYEMVDDGAGGRRLHINASNCVHCRTCDIMDPYQIVDWVPPEGGDGPRYVGL